MHKHRPALIACACIGLIGNTSFTREVFSSAPEQVIVVRLTAKASAP